MGLTLDQIVPWGRSLDEYVRMFDLHYPDLQRTILDCGGGPASFNAELTQRGGNVISCDPVYQFSAADIETRIRETYDVILQGVTANRDHYVWQEIASPAAMGDVRMAAMQQFLADFPQGLKEQRYRPESLPHLPFPGQPFDLALCSHLLFTYSEHLTLEFHQAAVREMLRVAREVRIFPLLTLAGARSPFVAPLITDLEAEGYTVHIQTVPYEFQKGGNEQLRILATRQGQTPAESDAPAPR